MSLSRYEDSADGFFAGQSTIPNIRRDFTEWHLGRSRFAIWAIDIDSPVIQKQAQAAQRHLSDLLHTENRRQPHITLKTCGFPCISPHYSDDFGVKTFEAQISVLRQARLKPFELNIGTLSSFSTAPFFHVNDANNSITALRACLAGSMSDNLNPDYTPHVTVGLYAGAWPREDVFRRLNVFPNSNISTGLIERISLMSYASTVIDGPLAIIADYHFQQAELQWHEPSAFA